MRRFISAVVAVGALNIVINPTGSAYCGGHLSAYGHFGGRKHGVSDSRLHVVKDGLPKSVVPALERGLNFVPENKIIMPWMRHFMQQIFGTYPRCPVFR